MAWHGCPGMLPISLEYCLLVVDKQKQLILPTEKDAARFLWHSVRGDWQKHDPPTKYPAASRSYGNSSYGPYDFHGQPPREEVLLSPKVFSLPRYVIVCLGHSCRYL